VFHFRRETDEPAHFPFVLRLFVLEQRSTSAQQTGTKISKFRC
jgi:hypothetical protein